MNKKNLRHLRNLRDKKIPQKDLCKSVKSVGQNTLRGICNDRTSRIRENP